jgi:hypothetical protein
MHHKRNKRIIKTGKIESISHFNDHYTKGWTNDFLEGKDYALKVA